jgi:hypothetical protein
MASHILPPEGGPVNVPTGENPLAPGAGSADSVHDEPVGLADLFISPDWEKSVIPLHVAHDRAIAGAMARDHYPIAYIPPTKAGVESLVARLTTAPYREHPGDRMVAWLTPPSGPDRDAAIAARKLFYEANLGGTGPWYESYEAGWRDLGDYEENMAPLAAADLAEWEDSILEERREKEAEKKAEEEKQARERATRLEREEAEAFFEASPDWHSRRIPLHVTHDRKLFEALSRDRIPVALIPPTAAGVRRLADELRAEPQRYREKDRQLVWVMPAVTASGDPWDPDYDEAAHAAQTQARAAAESGYDEFDYLKLSVSGTDACVAYYARPGIVAEWPDDGSGAAGCLASWEEQLRETPRERWLREEREMILPDEVVDAFTDAELDAYSKRFEDRGPIPPRDAKPAEKPPAAKPPALQVNEVQYRQLEAEAHVTLVMANRPPAVFVAPGGLSELYRPGPKSPRRIRAVTEGGLRRVFGEVADWVRKTKDEPVAAVPPQHLLESYRYRTAWPGIPDLTGVSTVPVLRPDGSLWQAPGYDPVTKTFFDPNASYVPIPARPTRGEAKAAAEFILHGVRQFPFASEVDRAAWLAMVLTPIARPAFAGPSPLFCVSGNVPGAGKGALVDGVAQIATGKKAPSKGYPAIQVGRHWVERDEELGKIAKGVAMEGHAVYHLDNCPRAHEFGGPGFESIVTQTENADRILGTNQAPLVPMLMLWAISGNLISPRSDMVRRTIMIRLLDLSERPEEREYEGPSLGDWAVLNRGKLVSAALTILSAYIKAGRPPVGLKKLGSFEPWSDLVRSAVVWLGYADPCSARAQMAAEDPEAVERNYLIDLLVEAGADREPVTAGQIVAKVLAELEELQKAREAAERACGAVAQPGKQLTLADLDAVWDATPVLPATPLATAFRRACPKHHKTPDAHALGMLFKAHRNRTTNGRRIESPGESRGSKTWRVVSGEGQAG